MSTEKMLSDKRKSRKKEIDRSMSSSYMYDKTSNTAFTNKSDVVKEEQNMGQDVSRMLSDTKKKKYISAIDEDKQAIDIGLKLGPKIQGLEKKQTSQQNLKASKKGYKEVKKMRSRKKKQNKIEEKAKKVLEEIE